MLMVVVTITGAMAMEQSVEGDVIDVPSVEFTVGDMEQQSFWGKLFGQPFVFVETKSADVNSDSNFKVISTTGAFGLITDGKYSSGDGASAGARCTSGQYVRVFEYAKNSAGSLHLNKIYSLTFTKKQFKRQHRFQ